jgi:putative transposase
LFLAVVIDLFSRHVVGWPMRADTCSDIVIDALRMAWHKRQPADDVGLIFYSDGGSQYASQAFRSRLHGLWHRAFDEPGGQLLGQRL